MAKKKKKTKRRAVSKAPKRPEKFNKFQDCVKVLKKSVYLIARGRKKTVGGKEVINWITLGSGFISAPYRFITAAHVINDQQKGEDFQHKEGDKYYLLRHDDENNIHGRIFEPKMNQGIFLEPEIDLGIIYLDEEFYQKDNAKFNDKNDFIRISKDFFPIGSEVGVLGYPLCKLEFQNGNFLKPKIGNILLRTDRGVVNCRYNTSEREYIYEFTLSFNPGNSGGPIFDVKTGRVISIVRGHKTIRISEKENIIPDKVVERLKAYKEKAYIETFNTAYSFGFATPTFLEVFKEHNII